MLIAPPAWQRCCTGSSRWPRHHPYAPGSDRSHGADPDVSARAVVQGHVRRRECRGRLPPRHLGGVAAAPAAAVLGSPAGSRGARTGARIARFRRARPAQADLFDAEPLPQRQQRLLEVGRVPGHPSQASCCSTNRPLVLIRRRPRGSRRSSRRSTARAPRCC